MSAPIYIPTNSVGGSPFRHTLGAYIFRCLLIKLGVLEKKHVITEGVAVVGRGWLIKKCDPDQLGKSDQ